jgi:uncharacterized protein with NRDE domain
MCLLVIAWRVHPQFPLIVAANRDEFHDRPAAPLHRWDGAAGLLAGRDLAAGGTWLGVAGSRFGVVTNFREMSGSRPAAPSRGGLIPAFLAGSGAAAEFMRGLETEAMSYAGFNLLASDGHELWYGANRAAKFARLLSPGIHGLSNHLLDTPWPKLERARSRFAAWLAMLPRSVTNPPAVAAPLFDLLADDRRVAEAELGDTGLAPEWEHALSSPFVRHPLYGTRCSTVALLGGEHAWIGERSFDAGARFTGEAEFLLNAETRHN